MTFENISSCSILQIGFYILLCFFFIFVLIITSYFIILFDYFTLKIGAIHSTYFFYNTFLSYIDNPSRKITADGYRLKCQW